MTPMKSIRAKCLDCCCGSSREVELCPAQSCALWPFRSGHNPARAGIGGKGFPKENTNSSNAFSAQREEYAECTGVGDSCAG